MPGKTTINGIVDRLEDEASYRKAIKQIKSLRALRDNQHGNSYLLQAIAWNRNKAAMYLCMVSMVLDIDALSVKDSFPTSNSTPLILCSKTGNNKIAMQLLGASNKADFINEPDYLGNTALHYACLTRNINLISALIASGADTHKRNNRNQNATDYYQMPLTEESVRYHYGTQPHAPHLMTYRGDWDANYRGTVNPDCSFLRWFIGSIVLNLYANQEKYRTITFDKEAEPAVYFFVNTDHFGPFRYTHNLIDALQYHQQARIPIMDNRIYQTATRLFLQQRNRATLSTDDEAALHMSSIKPTPESNSQNTLRRG